MLPSYQKIYHGHHFIMIISGSDSHCQRRSHWLGNDAISVIYKDSQGKLGERMLFCADEEKLELVQAGRPWSFDGNRSDFKLAAEAHRIRLAHIFDPLLAVHTSTVEPLPHQITAVYDCMIPKQPLKFLLADDPGSGKNIMILTTGMD